MTEEDKSVIVTDSGFGRDAWQGDWLELEPGSGVPDLAALGGVGLIVVDFPSFADGRGFSLAVRLRQTGYRGRLRARGHVIADQYAMARRAGFDEVEIRAEIALRQPEDQWLARADWRRHDYQARLRASV